MSLKKPTLKEVVEFLETLSEQGFIDVEPQERGYDLLPLYDFLTESGIAEKVSFYRTILDTKKVHWLRLINPEACDMLIKILKDALEPEKPDTLASYGT